METSRRGEIRKSARRIFDTRSGTSDGSGHVITPEGSRQNPARGRRAPGPARSRQAARPSPRRPGPAPGGQAARPSPRRPGPAPGPRPPAPRKLGGRGRGFRPGQAVRGRAEANAGSPLLPKAGPDDQCVSPVIGHIPAPSRRAWREAKNRPIPFPILGLPRPPQALPRQAQATNASARSLVISEPQVAGPNNASLGRSLFRYGPVQAGPGDQCVSPVIGHF